MLHTSLSGLGLKTMLYWLLDSTYTTSIYNIGKPFFISSLWYLNMKSTSIILHYETLDDIPSSCTLL